MNEENERLAAEVQNLREQFTLKWQKRFLLAVDAAIGAIAMGFLASLNEVVTDWPLYAALGLKAGAIKMAVKCLGLSMAGGAFKVWQTPPPSSYVVK